MSSSIANIVTFFETLRPDDVDRMAQVYAEDAYFKDPFNEVRGVVPIQAIFRHMFATLHEPRFVITAQVVQGDECFLTWDFVFRLPSYQPHILRVIHGSTHLRLAPDGRIRYHRDYWDAAEGLYEKLPLLGALMRWLKKRVNA